MLVARVTIHTQCAFHSHSAVACYVRFILASSFCFSVKLSQGKWSALLIMMDNCAEAAEATEILCLDGFRCKFKYDILRRKWYILMVKFEILHSTHTID